MAHKKKAEEAAVPASERYSIGIERQDDEILRTVLAAGQRHAGVPGRWRAGAQKRKSAKNCAFGS